MIVCYDLATRLTTYDFFNWAVHVKLLGASEIVFDTAAIRARKWSVEESRKRLHNYLIPGCALLGLPYRIGTDGDRIVGSHQMYALWGDLQKLGKTSAEMPRLHTRLAPKDARYTVTIRETFHNRYKNSDRKLWLKFADRIGAKVIEDHSREPIELHERVAWYAGAEMNYGVPNGPVSLIWWTPYPLTMFCDPEFTAKGFGGHQIGVGGQVPWLLPNQRMIWERPTLEGLLRSLDL